MDRGQHTVVKQISDMKTHAAKNSKLKLFMNLDHMNNAKFDVDLAKAQIEHEESIIVGLLKLQREKIR